MRDHPAATHQADAALLPGREAMTRESVFAFVRGASRDVDLAAIAGHFGVEPTQVAPQVDALCQSGLLIESRPGTGRSRRGKPRYVATTPASPPPPDPPDVLDPGDPPDPPETQDAYLGLSELLLAVLVGDRDPDDVGRMAGRLIGKAVVSSDASAHPDALGGQHAI